MMAKGVPLVASNSMTMAWINGRLSAGLFSNRLMTFKLKRAESGLWAGMTSTPP